MTLKRPCEVIRSDREVIENKLLARLEDGETVAIPASRDDLDLFIRGMNALAGDDRAAEFSHDLQQLKAAAFGPQ